MQCELGLHLHHPFPLLPAGKDSEAPGKAQPQMKEAGPLNHCMKPPAKLKQPY